MKILLVSLLLCLASSSKSQENLLTADTSIAIPKLNFDKQGKLLITASASSSSADFDFVEGKWKLHNRKLKRRLENCKEWTEFSATVEMHKILNGIGNIDKYQAEFDGKPFEGVALRLFDPKTRLWSIYWADSEVGKLDPPVVGSFENNIGHFFAIDKFKDKRIIMVFRWDIRDRNNPVWSQAFSPDEGKSWEWNHFNVSRRME